MRRRKRALEPGLKCKLRRDFVLDNKSDYNGGLVLMLEEVMIFLVV